MGKQSGLFDEEMRLRKLSELGDSLEKIGCIDLVSIFKTNMAFAPCNTNF